MTWPHGPLVLAPMAGGPGSPELVAAVSEAGLFGFLPAGYLSATDLESRITAIRALTAAPFGVNVFVPSPDSPLAHTEAMGYAARLAPWAADAGVELGRPSWDDDGYETKVDLLVGNPVPVVSFTFGWPSGHDVERLQDVGSQVWVTINDPAETEWAQELGVDGVVAQGWEAGGQRGGPVDNGEEHLPTAALLAAVRARTELPVLAAGGVMTGQEARALLEGGASAVAFGTAFLGCPEAVLAPVHLHALTHREGTTVTRAFTGRSARALRTTWTDVIGEGAPAAYPHVHHLTAPLRAHGKATGEADLVHLWAGEGHARLRPMPAADLARTLRTEAGF